MQFTVFLSGVHSGPNPSPGLGVALSLRQAFPDLRLIAVDYSHTSSGLHHPVFDDVLLRPAWEQCALESTVDWVTDLVRSCDSCWISGLDLEAQCLAASPEQGKRILVPPAASFDAIAKPTIAACGGNGYRIPNYQAVPDTPAELLKFCADRGWRVWLKGPQYEAKRVSSWRDYLLHHRALKETWGEDGVFLQEHIQGQEESICFAAMGGQLLQAVSMRKRFVTPEGKTWGGRISPLSDGTWAETADLIRKLDWSGGGEIECVRDDSGALYVMDFNPRFPAWVHGSTCVGGNLPASLVHRLLGTQPPIPAFKENCFFNRVVIEVPCRATIALIAPPMKPDGMACSSKHPSGMPGLSKRLRCRAQSTRRAAAGIDDPPLLAALERHAHEETPYRHEDTILFSERCRSVSGRLGAVAQNVGVPIRLAYSVKTQPSACFAGIAREAGMLAECISRGEYEFARAVGFSTEQIIVNGPGPRQFSPSEAPRFLFHDSLCSLSELSRHRVDAMLGVRLRPPGLQSRFGVPVEHFSVFSQLVDIIAESACAEIGCHFHYAASVVGPPTWLSLLDGVVSCAKQIEECTAKPVTTLDIGGGWFPWQFDQFLSEDAVPAFQKARATLPDLSLFLIEPGKALTQESSILFTRVVEVRRYSEADPVECVVDSSLNMLPMAAQMPHVIAHRSKEGWQVLPGGNDVIFGSICMEHDVIAEHIQLPSAIATGDLLAVLGAGAYDRSMSYDFGIGGPRGLLDT